MEQSKRINIEVKLKSIFLVPLDSNPQPLACGNTANHGNNDANH
jgi:hypothetical protein